MGCGRGQTLALAVWPDCRIQRRAGGQANHHDQPRQRKAHPGRLGVGQRCAMEHRSRICQRHCSGCTAAG